MGQALLIDVNTGFIKHRNGLTSALLSYNYDAAIGSLYAMNALLPNEYRISVDTTEYNQKVKGNLQVLCRYCITTTTRDEKEYTEPTPTDYDQIKILNIFQTGFDRIVTKKKYEKFWVCHKCKKQNRLFDSEFNQIVLKEPYFLKVVPAPPSRMSGLVDRATFHSKFERWARTFLAELEAEAGRFRAEYKPKKGDRGDLDIMPLDD